MSLADNKTWEMEKIDEKMLGTFSGGTDMLLRCITYVMTDPSAEVPVEEKVDWGEKSPDRQDGSQDQHGDGGGSCGRRKAGRVLWPRTPATRSTAGTARRWKT